MTINSILKRGKKFGWKFVKDREAGKGKFCGFYHGDPAAEVIYYTELTEEIVQKAFDMARMETGQ